MMVDTSPVEIEPHVVDEEDDDDGDSDDDEVKTSGAAMVIVGIVWFVTVLAIIISLLTRPLIMIGCLVGVNIVFPVIYVYQWFRSKKSQNYQMLDQDEALPIKISIVTVSSTMYD